MLTRLFQALIKALEDPESPVKKTAISSLEKIGTPEAISGIVKGLRDSDKICPEGSSKISNENRVKRL